MNILDCSFRYKIPLWGALLILVTALAVSGSALIQAYDELQEDQSIDAQVLASALVPALHPLMQQEDVWRVYESIAKPLEVMQPNFPHRVEAILVLDSHQRVFASTRPKAAPLQTPFAGLNSESAWVSAQMEGAWGGSGARVLRPPGSPLVYYLAPIVEGDSHAGTLVLVSEKGAVWDRFWEIAVQGWSIGALVLAILMPLNWYWGQRMARPLVELTERMGQIGHALPEPLDPRLYGHKDELGRLFAAYNQMLHELREKQELERQMVQSERLAALGQLSAGVAHEINNPLGGMLTAIDTLKYHADLDPIAAKTLALIERGLLQVKETVGALLVESRVRSRNLNPQDMEDIRTLIHAPLRKKAVQLSWSNGLSGELALPASLIRQILINLSLNAIQASAQGGEVDITLMAEGGFLTLAVVNGGKLLDEAQISHLFEPFSPLSEGGHGLGLWVTYQIVHQLAGDISAQRAGDTMRFKVRIPYGDPT